MKINEGFWPKPHFSSIGKNFPEIGLKYNQIYDVGCCMALYLCCLCKICFNWSRGLNIMSQKPDFQSEHTLAHSCYKMKKVGKNSILLCYIGEKWRKMAEVGLNWLKLKC